MHSLNKNVLHIRICVTVRIVDKYSSAAARSCHVHESDIFYRCAFDHFKKPVSDRKVINRMPHTV